jgi:hypothetical protein
MRIGHKLTFLCKARKYEALKAERMSSGSSALCKMLIKDQARGRLGYVISLAGPYHWKGVSAKAQKAQENPFLQMYACITSLKSSAGCMIKCVYACTRAKTRVTPAPLIACTPS